MKTFDGLSDVDMLARIMDAEAGQEGITGKAAVGAVIQNRARTGGYGNGIRGVITKPGQFSAINDVTGYAGGKGANDLFWREPSEESRQVAQAILAGNYEDITGGATHYFNPRHANPKWARGKKFKPIGNHVFGNADAGRVSGGGGADAVAGGESNDRLKEIEAELAKRQGAAPANGRLQEIEAELARRQQPMQPDPRDRADVENALGQLAQEDAQQSTLEPKGMTEGLFDEFTSGVVGNFGDNLEAAERAFPALFNDKNFVDEYQMAVSEERERAGEFAKENPVASTIANVGGAFATGVGAAKRGATLIGATQSVPKAIAAGAMEGGVYGAIWGAGASEGDITEIVDDAIKSGALGAALGGVISGGVQRITNGVARSAAVRALKPTADLKAARDAAYDAASKLGASYKAGAVDNLVNRMGHQLRSGAFNEELHKGSAAAMQYAHSLKGTPLTLTELDQLRQVIARDAGGSTLPADKAFAAKMIGEIDDFIDTVAPRGTGPGASVRATSRAMKTARTAHSKFKKAELIDGLLLEAADQAAATGSGGNINNAIRQKFKSLLKNKKQIKYFTNEEKGAMRRIVRGTQGDNLMRLVGKLAPGGNGLMTALSLGAASVNPAALAVSGAATGAKALADRGTGKAVQALQTTVQGGGASAATITPQARALFSTIAGKLGYELSPEGQLVPITQVPQP